MPLTTQLEKHYNYYLIRVLESLCPALVMFTRDLPLNLIFIAPAALLFYFSFLILCDILPVSSESVEKTLRSPIVRWCVGVGCFWRVSRRMAIHSYLVCILRLCTLCGFEFQLLLVAKLLSSHFIVNFFFVCDAPQRFLTVGG